MKLYTEEQVRIAIDIALNGINQYYTPIIDRIKPIELPSDEEIKEKANSLQDEKDGALYNEGINEGFYLGVEYMKEQILNQNK